MTGFIKGLFGSKKADEVAQRDGTPKPKQQEAFYLSADDAKTYGDIEFMRSSKSTRRTFPKTKFGTDNEFIQTISSLEKIKKGQGMISMSGSAPESQAAASRAEIEERRRTDTNMDMFRNMAREMRKR
ncbi:MAG: hypothetical protein Kow00121_27840 [Elainellaceae cyanobacterium]